MTSQVQAAAAACCMLHHLFCDAEIYHFLPVLPLYVMIVCCLFSRGSCRGGGRWQKEGRLTGDNNNNAAPAACTLLFPVVARFEMSSMIVPYITRCCCCAVWTVCVVKQNVRAPKSKSTTASERPHCSAPFFFVLFRSAPFVCSFCPRVQVFID